MESKPSLGYLVVLLAMFWLALIQSEAANISTWAELYRHRGQLLVVNKLLLRDCNISNIGSEKLTETNVLKNLYQQRVEQLVLCRRQRGKTIANSAPTTPPSSGNDSLNNCPSDFGYSRVEVKFLEYNHHSSSCNSFDQNCNNVLQPYNLALESCISPLHSRACVLCTEVTGTIRNANKMVFHKRFGFMNNPITVDVGEKLWKGAHLHFKVTRKHHPFDQINQFTYELSDSQGSLPRSVTLQGTSGKGARLDLQFTVLPPKSLSTKSTSTATPPPKTTSEKAKPISSHPTQASPINTTTLTPNTTALSPSTTTLSPSTTTSSPSTTTSSPSTTKRTTPSTTKTTLSTKSTTTTPTSSTKVVTTGRRMVVNPKLKPCFSATNLTDGKRTDTSGKDLRGGGTHSENGYFCDRRSNLEWFRFTGYAGTKMLNYCPQYKSCGTEIPYWTKGPIPDKIGERKRIKIFGSRKGGVGSCRDFVRKVKVMRCSDTDIIYQYVDDHVFSCAEGFCGMF